MLKLISFLILSIYVLNSKNEAIEYIVKVGPTGNNTNNCQCVVTQSNQCNIEKLSSCETLPDLNEVLKNYTSSYSFMLNLYLEGGQYKHPIRLLNLTFENVHLKIQNSSAQSLFCPPSPSYQDFYEGLLLYIENSLFASISIEYLEFSLCGNYSPAIFINNVISNTSLRKLTFKNNTQTCIFALNSPNILIEQSIFLLNTWFYNYTYTSTHLSQNEISTVLSKELLAAVVQQAGAIYITETLGLEYNEYMVKIIGNTFINNTCEFISVQELSGHIFKEFLGSGINLDYKYEAYNTLVKGNYFRGNTACKSGGGLSIIMNNTHNDRNINIEENQFIGNIGEFAGGGMVIRQEEDVLNVEFIIRNNTFRDNIGMNGGGGIDVFFPLESKLNYEKDSESINREELFYKKFRGSRINITDCLFENNWAKSGLSGDSIRIISIRKYGYYAPIVFIGNTNIIYNKAANTKRYNYAIFVSGAEVYFYGEVNLIKDKSIQMYRNVGGIDLIDSLMIVNGNMTIYGFAGLKGGGIQALKRSRIMIFNHTSMLFLNNSASEIGGAIAHETSNSEGFTLEARYNIYCPIGMLDAPRSSPLDWDVNFNFTLNKAQTIGGAIYISKIEACDWFGDEEELSSRLDLVFNTKGFHYDRNTIHINYGMYFNSTSTGSNLSSIPHTFKLVYEKTSIPKKSKCGITTMLDASPGISFGVPIIAYDFRGEPTTATVRVHHYSPDAIEIIEGRTLYIEPSFYYCVEEHPNDPNKCADLMPTVAYRMKKSIQDDCEKENFYLELFVLKLQDFLSSIKQEINFTTDYECAVGYSLNSELGVCYCDTDIPGVKKCIDGKAYISNGYWSTPANKSSIGKNIVLPCPSGQCSCDITDRSIHSCVAKRNPDDYCEGTGRGIMCGECLENYTSMSPLFCAPRTDNPYPFIILIYIVITASICIAVFLLNIRIWNGIRAILIIWLLVPYILYFDVIRESKTPRAILSLTQLGSLNFMVVKEAVPFNDMNYLQARLIGYYPMISVLIIGGIFVILSWLVNKFRKVKTFQLKRITDSFLFLWFLIYGKTIIVILASGTCTLSKSGGKTRRLFYSGNIECFGEEHLPYFVLATLLSIIVILPTPVLIACITNKYFLERNIKWAILVSNFKNSSMLFWSWEFLRIIILMCAAVFDSYLKNAGLLLILVVLIWTIHQLALPYRETAANLIESVSWIILAILLIISSSGMTSNYILGWIQHLLFISIILIGLLSLVLFMMQSSIVYSFKFSKVRLKYEQLKSNDKQKSRITRYLYIVLNFICGDLEAELNARTELRQKGDKLRTRENRRAIISKEKRYEELEKEMELVRRDTLINYKRL